MMCNVCLCQQAVKVPAKIYCRHTRGRTCCKTAVGVEIKYNPSHSVNIQQKGEKRFKSSGVHSFPPLRGAVTL